MFEQTSWMLFLKYLDDLEYSKAQHADLMGQEYNHIIDSPYRWNEWAAPKNADGDFDADNALTGDDLMHFVDKELFPYLKSFKQLAENPNTIEYKIGEIFDEIKLKYNTIDDALEQLDSTSEIRQTFLGFQRCLYA